MEQRWIFPLRMVLLRAMPGVKVLFFAGSVQIMSLSTSHRGSMSSIRSSKGEQKLKYKQVCKFSQYLVALVLSCPTAALQTYLWTLARTEFSLQY